LVSAVTLEVAFEEGRCGSLVVPMGPTTYEYLADTDQLSDGYHTWDRLVGG
jgi:hypothetical protein